MKKSYTRILTNLIFYYIIITIYAWFQSDISEYTYTVLIGLPFFVTNSCFILSEGDLFL